MSKINFMGYNVFLTIELARLAGIIENGIEYDTTWELGESLYNEFRGGEFDLDSEPEYECIEKFLSNKMDIMFNEFLEKNCTVSKSDDTDEYIESMLEQHLCIKVNGVGYWIPCENIYHNDNSERNDDNILYVKFYGKRKTLTKPW